MSRRKNSKISFLLILILLIVATLLLSSESGQAIAGQFGADDTELGGYKMFLPLAINIPPATLDIYATTDIPSLDPQTAEDSVSVDYIENLFVTLTNFDPLSEQIVPEAASSWNIDNSGLIYTFQIRPDISWVKYDSTTGTVKQVLNGNNPRFVTASDFVNGFRRACNPNSGSYYSSVIAPVIKGCAAVLNYPNPNNIPQSLINAIGVSAPTQTTFQVVLETPAAHFLTLSSMWTLSAIPQWTIDSHGNLWTEPGNIVTNGRFALTAWIHNNNLLLRRNPWTPTALFGSGNVDNIATTILPDTSTGYAQWLNNQVDIAPIPLNELQNHLNAFPNETDKIPDQAVFYFEFRTTKFPFNDVRVRRALSAAIDREALVDQVYQDRGLPMVHFAPPGIFGAPPIDQIGVGFNISFAQAQLTAAGYPNCAGFPTIVLMGYSGQSTADWMQFTKEQWTANLGCNPNAIQVVQVSFSELLTLTNPYATPDSQAPHMWTLGWGPDFNDEKNWVDDVLWCQAFNRSKRPCSATDNLIVQARQETNTATRAALYTQIENAFFGQTGEFPISPLWTRANFLARHTWISRTPVLFGGDHWYDWQIDWLAKLASQN
jgi:ABC-type oligopeptide transport system substrate-binding subunit